MQSRDITLFGLGAGAGAALGALRPRARGLVAAMLVALLTVFLAGCGGGGGGGSASSGGDVVTGQVLDSANADAGVSGATITIGGVTATTTTTAAATATSPVGSFTINNASIGSTTAKIVVGTNAAQTIAFSPSVTSGTNAPLTLYINIGEITGKVLEPNGAAAGGAFVSVAVNGENIQANSDGTFLLTNIPAGATTVTAVLGTASVTVPVTVGNGDTAIGNLTLVANTNTNPPGPPYNITGTVNLAGTGSAAATPASGAQVFLLSNGTQLEIGTTNSNGVYTFYVPDGTYLLKFSYSEYVSTTESVTVNSVTTPATAATVTLQPQP